MGNALLMLCDFAIASVLLPAVPSSFSSGIWRILSSILPYLQRPFYSTKSHNFHLPASLLASGEVFLSPLQSF